MTASVLPFPGPRAVCARPGAVRKIVALEPLRSMRELARLRPGDADYMPATVAVILLQGWFEEAEYFRARGWADLREATIARIEAMRFDTAPAARIRAALGEIRDAFAAKLREAGR